MKQSKQIFVTDDGSEISARTREFVRSYLEEMVSAAPQAKASANADAKDLNPTDSPAWQWVKEKAEIAADAFANAFGSALGQALAAGLVMVVVRAFRPLGDRSEVQS